MIETAQAAAFQDTRFVPVTADEVAAIFTDEATELIEASERALSDWRSQPSSQDLRMGLKRPLHTLKGGARMAGIMSMGDLSHELESLVMLVENLQRKDLTPFEEAEGYEALATRHRYTQQQIATALPADAPREIRNQLF